ncbi:hypothetical protein [Maricaulis maris]|jgi:hypothetical protein|uniref:hypothetical protein n=1 Tax=Maricaulis maris TaxID=74318 RepID=UPI00291EC934|nr:hypothetical protein MACH15_12220 [Maricaulis maris]
MFGFRGGESPAVLSRQKSAMHSAQLKWPFLTNFDCSTIKDERQLSAMVQTRMSVSEETARDDVHQWFEQQPAA